MNLLKSIFISSYLSLLMAVCAYALWQLTHAGSAVLWGGVLLSALPLLALISWLMLFKSAARTSNRLPVINILGIMGVGITLVAPAPEGLPSVLAALSWLGFLLYNYWYSSFGGRTPSAQLGVGKSLPAFTLRDGQGHEWTSATLAGHSSILIFYRGNWCPLCVAQIKELAQRYRELAALGVRVLLISPQPHEHTLALSQRFDVAFEFMTDTGGAAARTLGIAQANGTPMGMQMFGYDNDTVLPTVIITDPAGRVVWTHQTDNYRVRPDPDTYFAVLREHKLVPQA